LLARFVDDPDLADPDAFVGSDTVVTTTGAVAIECDTQPPDGKSLG
jgi:hypothetical protein